MLSDASGLTGASRAVGFRSRVQATELMPMERRDLTRLQGRGLRLGQRHGTGRRRLEDLSSPRSSDCFTIAELLIYEAIGLALRGQGRRASEEGWVEPDGRLPINPSGGLKAKGHPVGATGVSMHVMAAKQLTRGGRRHADPRRRACGRVQHGWRRRRQLRQRARTSPLTRPREIDPFGGEVSCREKVP
ncbi:MAG: hypothetical protein U5L11_07350 [Arhodomonas sp.]|nr:hypothetical protein [Arhodomonas sp.]